MQGLAWQSLATTGQAWPGLLVAWPGNARPGQARIDQARPGHAWTGQARPGLASPNCQIIQELTKLEILPNGLRDTLCEQADYSIDHNKKAHDDVENKHKANIKPSLIDGGVNM